LKLLRGKRLQPAPVALRHSARDGRARCACGADKGGWGVPPLPSFSSCPQRAPDSPPWRVHLSRGRTSIGSGSGRRPHRGRCVGVSQRLRLQPHAATAVPISDRGKFSQRTPPGVEAHPPAVTGWVGTGRKTPRARSPLVTPQRVGSPHLGALRMLEPTPVATDPSCNTDQGV